MVSVVVTGWDADARLLRYVPVNGGEGGGESTVEVPAEDAGEVSAECGRGPLPRAGELVIEGGRCLLDLCGPPARWCTAKRDGAAVRLTERDTNDRVVTFAAASLGLPGEEATLARVQQIGDFLLFDPPGPVPGCWVRPGGLSGWLEALRQELAVAKARRRRRDRFVNPYTFVPFPARVVRREPAGHEWLAPGRLSGRLVVRWEFTGPAQAPDGSADGAVLRFPGSSVKGVVRSVHETMAGGCLRIVDEEFVPSYRDTASALSDDWTLAVVARKFNGQPLTVRPATQVVWVRSRQLVAACRAGLRTGSRVTLDAPERKNSLNRYELDEQARVSAGGDWVVLLTDAGARPEKRRDGSAALYFAACGHIPDSTPEAEVDEAVWRRFRQAVAGAREAVQNRRPARRELGHEKPAQAEQNSWVPVTFRGQVIGERKSVTGWFEEGDVLWVRRDRSGRVVEVRLSAIWRHPGTGPLGERVPPDLLPCTDPVSLCPSCRLFGSADTQARDEDGRADQRAYAGHVRFGDAVSAGPVALTAFRRAPMGTPHPGAGQFYLSYADRRPAGRGRPPTREWGADPDRSQPRPVRGRKFYWHSAPGTHPPRHEAQEHHRPQMVADKLLAPPGTTLTQTVTFDNLDPAELGGLLAALQPDLALRHGGETEERGRTRLHLGGGKPLGLGSCTATVVQAQVWDAGSRYGDSPPPAYTPEVFVDAFVASCPDEVTATWAALSAVLGAGTVNGARVSYPPGADWTDRQQDPKRFDEPFAFFTVTSGMYLAKGEERPLLPLPDPTAPDQTLPIIHEEHQEHRPKGRRS
ncbi:TIGR03986 family CRISPR-associated RAMP protein [Micromonospora sp. WMMD734]|uniref:TIGR03986 family type III CRISPR-associated RAMP protein n=1 Tax=Micromonospora sp. WMMD734 TaxID=3404129 RepID=UPI003B92EA78